MKSLEEKTIQTDKIYKGKLLDLRKDKVLLPNKKVGYREWINHPGAACCLPVLTGNKIILIKQYRYAVKEESIEIPAGKLDLNEDPKECAYRELKEETGYKAKELTLLTSIYPAIGFANEIIWIYLAQNLKMGSPNTDDDEYGNAYTDAFDKPKPGQTKQNSITLYKGGKKQRKAIHVSIYGRKNGFEVTTYIN